MDCADQDMRPSDFWILVIDPSFRLGVQYFAVLFGVDHQKMLGEHGPEIGQVIRVIWGLNGDENLFICHDQAHGMHGDLRHLVPGTTRFKLEPEQAVFKRRVSDLRDKWTAGAVGGLRYWVPPGALT